MVTEVRGTINQRIQKLKEAIRPETYQICTEKAKLMTESWKKTEEQPYVTRRAKALANLLDNITIFIEDGELIVGWPASKPMGFELSYNSTKWADEEREYYKEEKYEITDEAWADIKSLNEYWHSRTIVYREAPLWDDERLWPYLQAGIRPPRWKNKEEGQARGSAGGELGYPGGFVCLDYEMLLNRGLNSLIEEAKEELRNLRFTSPGSVEKSYFLKSVITCHEAIIRYANRYAALAAEMASKEADPTRKKELERISATCQWVPANPARTFNEAIQSYWFIVLMLVCGVFPLGRFDQFMYPFYKKDIEEGRITADEALELLQCFRIKMMEPHHVFGKEYRQKHAGFARWNNMVIGGLTPDGRDATNDLTYLVLEAAKRCQTPQHTISLRVHEGTPESLMLKALELVKTGIGMPAFAGDKSYIEYMLSQGVPLNDARNYALLGCFDGTLPGKSSVIAGISIFGVPIIFDIFMHNGVEPKSGRQLSPKTGELESFETFDDLMRAFKEQFTYYTKLNAEWMEAYTQVSNEIDPNPISSSLMVGGIKAGKNIAERKFSFEQTASIVPAGMINVVDSLAAIKKLVFDEKKITMKELKAALEANWQGDRYQEIRKMCLAVPKYGNDDDYVDLIAKELYQFFADMVATIPTILGGTVKPSGVSVSIHGPVGTMTGATPDGRYDGEVVADGTMSPAQGRDTHGPIAVIKSASKIDQTRYQSTLLNMKFHPSSLKTAEDLRKLSDMIRTYFAMGGKHIQFNVADKKTLLDAQKQPEKYRDLIVRVAGYSAYYTQLTKIIQDEIIQRMEF